MLISTIRINMSSHSIFDHLKIFLFTPPSHMVQRDTSIRCKAAGLKNKAHDCFLNSALQCLLSISDLTTFYGSQAFLPSQPASQGMSNLIQNYKLGTCSPEHLLTKIRHQMAILNGRQQDSHEFTIGLLDYLFKELSKDRKEVYSTLEDLEKIKSENFIADQFFGMLQTNVICGDCKCVFKQPHHFVSLSLSVKDTIKEGIDSYFDKHVLDGQNKWKCEKCLKYNESVHSIEIIDYPKKLIVHLLRFEGMYRKNDKLVDVDHEIKLSGIKYEVIGIICHSGVLNSGHYIAYAKRNSSWWCFDDERIESIGKPPLNNSKAYLIFYQRK